MYISYFFIAHLGNCQTCPFYQFALHLNQLCDPLQREAVRRLQTASVFLHTVHSTDSTNSIGGRPSIALKDGFSAFI